MKRQYYKFGNVAVLFALGVISLLYACGQEDGDVLRQEPEMVPVSVQAGVQGETVTRAYDYEVLTAGSIGVFRLVTNDYTLQENVQYSKTSATGWQPAVNTNIIYVGAKEAELCAYYPYGSVTFDDSSNKVKATLTATYYQASKDMSYATTGGDAVWKKTPQATFLMIHAYARLSFNVTRDADYPTSCKVSKLVLKPAAGTYFQTRTIDISQGEVSLANGTTASQYEWVSADCSWSIKDGVSVGTPNESMDVLLPPQECAANKMPVTLTIDGVNYSADVPTGSGSSFTALKAGTRHRIELSVKGSGLSVTGMKTYPWETSTVSGDNGAVMD